MARTPNPTITDEERFADAKSYLLTNDGDGNSVYDHLTEMFNGLLRDPSANYMKAPEKFSESSLEHRRKRYDGGTKPDARKAYWARHKAPADLTKHAESTRKLFNFPPPVTTMKVVKPNPHTTITTTSKQFVKGPPFRELAADLRFLSLAGFGIPQTDAFTLDLAICKLATAKHLMDVRYFGRIYGRDGYYDIVESRRWFPDGKDHKLFVEKFIVENARLPRKSMLAPTQEEPEGRGANRWTYWLRPSLQQNEEFYVDPADDDTESGGSSEGWIMLPDASPHTVVAARNFRQLLTGRLDTQVQSHPPFPGQEAELLRAQIARIQSATTIAPLGSVGPHEPTESEEEDDNASDDEEEGKPKEEKWRPVLDVNPNFVYTVNQDGGVISLSSLERWIHCRHHLHLNGRATRAPAAPEEDDEDDGPTLNPPIVEVAPDDEKELLEPLARDKAYKMIALPKPPPEEEEEDEEKPEDEEVQDQEEVASGYAASTIADDGVDEPEDESGQPRRRIPAWTVRTITPALAKSGSVVVVKSLRWPGAFAWCGNGAKNWGCIYIGNGTKKSFNASVPPLPPPILGEEDELPTQTDPSAKTEKLLNRGEEPPPDRDEEDPAEAAPEEMDY